MKKNIVKEALHEYLFKRLGQDLHYQAWERFYEFPNFIEANLAYPLRDYQKEAVKHFIYLFEKKREAAKHLLFNMATGTGKTLTMAALVLYLYKQGYRNFIFIVHQLQIKEQAEKNLTDVKFNKYLFKRNGGVRIDGQRVEIGTYPNFIEGDYPYINFAFLSSAGLYSRIKNPRENALSLDDFETCKSIILADEAHRLNVETRKKKTKTEEEEIKNWENAVQAALKARPDNILLEFTATVELRHPHILEKYKDKLLYRYEFTRFMDEGYSKEVKTLYNQVTEVLDQRRLLVLNAVALSQYRKLLSLTHGMQDPSGKNNLILNPVILFKSNKIKQSEDDREEFHKIIDALTPHDFSYLQNLSEDMRKREGDHTLSRMFTWIASPASGLVHPQDSTGLKLFIQTIQEDFKPENTLTYNSQKKDNAHLLTMLDQPDNRIRAIFSVNALNEGWDVLSLFDIVHFDISASKKVSLQDVQLIGRGARLFPYQLSKKILSKNNNDLFNNRIGEDSYKRKFDGRQNDERRIFETLYYHFVKTGTFLEELQKELLEEGIIRRTSQKRTLHMKDAFKQSQTYQKGFVLVNQCEARQKEPDEVIERVLRKKIEVRNYRLHTDKLLDQKRDKELSSFVPEQKTITLDAPYFSKHIIRKALLGYEGGFFTIGELSKHIIGLKSLDDFIEKNLSCFEIYYQYEKGKEFEALEPEEKLHLLLMHILPEVYKIITRDLPRFVGGRSFYPVPLAKIFEQIKDLWILGRKEQNSQGEWVEIFENERVKPQKDHENIELRCDLTKADWYAYNENYGTIEEKFFIKFIESQIGELKAKFPDSEIYLLRNEQEYCVFDIENGQRFFPDYLLFINDIRNNHFYYQCLFEVKGSHLIEHDQWKEDALLKISSESKVKLPSEGFNIKIKGEDYQLSSEFLNELRSEDYQIIKSLGFKFFNEDKKYAFMENLKSQLGY